MIPQNCSNLVVLSFIAVVHSPIKALHWKAAHQSESVVRLEVAWHPLTCTLLLYWCSGWIVRPPQWSRNTASLFLPVYRRHRGRRRRIRPAERLVGRRSFSSSAAAASSRLRRLRWRPTLRGASCCGGRAAGQARRGVQRHACAQGGRKVRGSGADAAVEAALGYAHHSARPVVPVVSEAAAARIFLKKPVRGQSVLCQYTLPLGASPATRSGRRWTGRRDSSRRGLRFYAGVGQAKFREPVVGFDLTVLSMEEGEARRVIVPKSLACLRGGRAHGLQDTAWDDALRGGRGRRRAAVRRRPESLPAEPSPKTGSALATYVVVVIAAAARDQEYRRCSTSGTGRSGARRSTDACTCTYARSGQRFSLAREMRKRRIQLRRCGDCGDYHRNAPLSERAWCCSSVFYWGAGRRSLALYAVCCVLYET